MILFVDTHNCFDRQNLKFKAFRAAFSDIFGWVWLLIPDNPDALLKCKQVLEPKT